MLQLNEYWYLLGRTIYQTWLLDISWSACLTNSLLRSHRLRAVTLSSLEKTRPATIIPIMSYPNPKPLSLVFQRGYAQQGMATRAPTITSIWPSILKAPASGYTAHKITNVGMRAQKMVFCGSKACLALKVCCCSQYDPQALTRGSACAVPFLPLNHRCQSPTDNLLKDWLDQILPYNPLFRSPEWWEIRLYQGI